MAIRQTRLITKNSVIPSQSLPTTGILGEAIVNLGDGILFFSGGTSGSPTWVPSDNKASYFEVGSNLNDLKIRNRITSYEGSEDVSGKFLSGTTSGFTLADISSIIGVDIYVDSFTYSDNLFTIGQTEGQADLTVSLDTMTGLTVNGILSTSILTATTLNANTVTITNLGVTTAHVDTLNVTAGTVTTLSSTDITTTNLTGTTITGIDIYSTDLYLDGKIQEYGGLTDLTGKFLSGTTNGFVISNISDIVGVDSYVTGFTYSPTTNGISLTQNNAGSNFSLNIERMSGLTITNDLNVEGDTIINGNLTILGSAISAFTTELYVEDPNIALNYNPTGDTIATSVNAGFTIQDGNGISSGDVNLDIIRLANLTGLTATNIPDVSNYSGDNGYVNRGFITQLNDIVIRSTDVSDNGTAGDINGVRVLAEWDTLYGGEY